MQDDKDIIIDETIATPDVVGDEPLTMAEDVAVDATAPEVAVDESAQKSAGKRFTKSPQSSSRHGRRTPRREERPRSEFDQKIIAIRRVTRVVAGGRRMSFAVALVAGNRKGKVGIGTGKAVDTALAIEKAFRDAKKNMIVVPLTKTNSIPHDATAKYSASVVSLIPSRGRGLVAGGAVRSVLELAGVTDVSVKLLSRSKNAINNARVAVKALSLLRNRRSK
jgi:small subunit ribosomal protein S5